MSDKYVSIPVTKSLSQDLNDIVGELRLSKFAAVQLASLMDNGLDIRLSMCAERRSSGLQIRCVSFLPVPAEMADDGNRTRGGG